MLLKKANSVIDDIMNKFEADTLDMLVKRCGDMSFLTIKEKEMIIDPDFLRLSKILSENRNENIKDTITLENEVMKINETLHDIQENLIIISSTNYDPIESIFNIFEITNIILYLLKLLGENKNMTSFDVLRSIQEHKYIEVDKLSLLEKIKIFFKKRNTETLLSVNPFAVVLVSILSDVTVNEIVEEIFSNYIKK